MKQTRDANLPVIRKSSTWRTDCYPKGKKSRRIRALYCKSARRIYANIFTKI